MQTNINPLPITSPRPISLPIQQPLHHIGNGQRTGQARTLNAQQIDKAVEALLSPNNKVLEPAALLPGRRHDPARAPRQLRPDARIVRRQGLGLYSRQVLSHGLDRLGEPVLPRRQVGRVVDPLGVRAEANAPREVEREVRA